MFERLAKSTVRIECGTGTGSGFFYRDASIVVTNYHVVKGRLGQKIHVVAEDGEKVSAKIVGHSPESQFDFAILRLDSEITGNTEILLPNILRHIPRGTEIIFSGFPHGIPHLLVHSATVSGPAVQTGFYIDGSVNGGNSGGPVVDRDSGEVIGIITQRRFLGGAPLEDLQRQVGPLLQHCEQMAGRGGVKIMGVDFGQFAAMMASGFQIMEQLIIANANSGIGIGFRIEFVDAEYDRLNLP